MNTFVEPSAVEGMGKGKDKGCRQAPCRPVHGYMGPAAPMAKGVFVGAGLLPTGRKVSPSNLAKVLVRCLCVEGHK